MEAVAAEIGGLALVGDVSHREDVEAWVERTENELGPIDLLVNNAGIGGRGSRSSRSRRRSGGTSSRSTFSARTSAAGSSPADGRARRRADREHRQRRLLPAGDEPDDRDRHAYGPSKAALGRFSETLAAALGSLGVRVFLISPGLVRTDMTEPNFPDDAPWTPPELAPRLVRVLASGRADALAGRYLHAEHDDVEDLIRRADEIVADDLNAIRLRR